MTENPKFIQKERFHIPFLFELRDGRILIIRHIYPESKHDREGFYEILKSLTKKEFYLRFFQQRNLSDEYTRKEMIQKFVVNVDGTHHVCLIAEEIKTSEVLASARYIEIPGKNLADVSITVQKKARRNGIARLMIAFLAFDASQKGIEKFNIEVHGDNEPMIQLISRDFFKAICDSYTEDEEIIFLLETRAMALRSLEKRHG